MGAVLTKIDDPRDLLEKATRDEIFDFAVAQGVAEITEDMPAIIMRNILREKKKTNIKIPDRPLGANPGVELIKARESMQETETVPEVNADDDLMRQYQTSKVEPQSMTMGQLRAECKRRGIKMARTDNMQTLREKLSV